MFGGTGHVTGSSLMKYVLDAIYQVFLQVADLLKAQGYNTIPAPTEAELTSACKRARVFRGREKINAIHFSRKRV